MSSSNPLTVTNGKLTATAANFTNSSFSGTTSFAPASASPINVAKAQSANFTVQTTSGSHTNVVLAAIPLPQNTSSPIASPTPGILTLTCLVKMISTTTAAYAVIQISQAYYVASGGGITAIGVNTITWSVGSNGGIPPAGWSVNVATSGTIATAVANVQVNGDATVTVNCYGLASWDYTA